MNQQTTYYFSSQVLQKAKQIIQDSSIHPYEHQVATWMGTLLKNVFHGDPWSLTPEKRDDHSNKKPDFMIHKYNHENDLLVPYLYVELKKKGGDRFEKALHQAIEHIAETMDEKGNMFDSEYEVYVIIQRGLDIGFFEYFNTQTDLEERGIGNFYGCVSLTQQIYKHEEDVKNNEDPLQTEVVLSTTQGLKLLMFDNENLKTLKDEKEEEIRDRAEEYITPCVFNIVEHETEINLIMNHIVHNKPRV